MVYYSTKNMVILNFINYFCNKTDSEKIDISEANDFKIDEDDIFFIPIYGEEELNDKWELFFLKYSKNSSNISKNTFFYLYGVYDLEINKNTTIIRQINKILEFLSLQINIFPLKIMKNYISLESLIYYYIHNYRKVKKNTFIDKTIFLAKQQFLQNDSQTINFTSKTDEYSSIIDKINIKYKKEFLIKLLSSISSINIILNRTKSINLNKVLKKVKNNQILKLQLKSNKLKKNNLLLGFKSLEILNLTANLFNFFNIDKLPKNLISLNISKNRITKIKIKNTRLKIKKLIVFNNKITDMKFLHKFPNLEYLNIGLNPIEKFPNSIFELQKLEHLNISYINIEYIPEEIFKLKQLKSIDITGSRISIFCDIIKRLQNNNVRIIS